ncbi:hypothetical protein CVS30_02770 [Arthrobacter psychrolactophilus]|uniref:Cell wall-binding repeat-containing protein n=1 Tax=Arthrobacter psychrolactophilus TaxID=92442 RepID=A0A2V5IUF9_9MICC|nr:cell wall-binding repeat-containing protein [Arthrobacter psychrolactophilus]PYI39621.1 hypothetical protein CVS30_02770 [Arthrobacter psychrolactophilus]
MIKSKSGMRAMGALAISTLVAISAVVVGPVSPANAAGLNGSGPIRMAGADRYSTAQAISKSNFPSQTEAVFLATGTNFPDALSAGPAAGKAASPVLLTASNGLSAAAAQELDRLRPASIYVMGGTGAISNAVVNAAKAYSGNVVRISGADRYATATGTSKLFWPTSETVYVASGASFADALSGGALAAKTGSPILLTAAGGLVDVTKTELRRLAPSQVVVLGGTGAVSDTAYAQIAAAVPGAAISRIQGSDRLGTSAAIAKAGWGTSAKAMYAVAWNFPDALAGVAAAAANGAPLLLTNPGCMPASVWDESSRLGVSTKGILGGQGVLSINAVSAGCTEAYPTPNASASARSYSGHGDDVIEISKPDGANSVAIATLSHRGSSNFIVTTLDAGMNANMYLAITNGDYAGTVIFDEYDWLEPTTRLQISADGPWTISIASVRSAPSYGKQHIDGRGDAVFNYTGSAGSAKLNHYGSSHFIIEMTRLDGSWDPNDLVLVNEGSYSGTRVWPKGPTVTAVLADGTWSASIR